MTDKPFRYRVEHMSEAVKSQRHASWVAVVAAQLASGPMCPDMPAFYARADEVMAEADRRVYGEALAPAEAP